MRQVNAAWGGGLLGWWVAAGRGGRLGERRFKSRLILLYAFEGESKRTEREE
jgi:hypothetical protein